MTPWMKLSADATSIRWLNPLVTHGKSPHVAVATRILSPSGPSQKVGPPESP